MSVQFQTAALATPPNLTVIATDPVGDTHYQRVKLDLGSPGESRPVSSTDGLPVSLVSPLSAFGELTTADLKPFVQAMATYNRIPANLRTYLAGTGSAGAQDKLFRVSTGTGLGGYGVVRSFRALNYRPGMGGVARFTAAFTPGVPLSQQGAGLFNVGDGLLFGYNGADFGILYQHGGEVEIRELTITVGAGGAETLTVVLNGTTYNPTVVAATAGVTAQLIADWFTANQTAWEVYANATIVQFASTSDGPKTGTYSIASTGTTAGTFARITAGIEKTEEFIARADWNIDPRPDIDPTLLNVFQISYQYLGGGNIFFAVEDPNTGRLEPVHQLRLAGTLSVPSVGNPSMKIGIYAASLGSIGTDLVATTASLAAFVQGNPDRIRNPRSINSIKTAGTTSIPILSIRNRWTFGGTPNQIEIELDNVTAWTATNQGCQIGIYTNATLTAPVWTYVNEPNLVAEVDTSATAFTGGTLLYSFPASNGSGNSQDLGRLRIRIPAGLAVTIVGQVNSGASSAINASLTWYEDF